MSTWNSPSQKLPFLGGAFLLLVGLLAGLAVLAVSPTLPNLGLLDDMLDAEPPLRKPLVLRFDGGCLSGGG
ncbi:hypothetical protein P280DRAFT_185129 [Massarina eburnea CBS 473.64]|uniref:Uncharacterized protein n=1 Tax=Massarina eburnea CBS 473.64 TaxID=1395130 RepID=A0A6A6SAX3_9PLEO|nr:hypothetical protein P280DRAFT_185129 [Massarina eburnea CBS 473.64]